jgi:nucleolysin TIA-1/TIAR
MFIHRMGVQIPGAWQGVPTQAQIPAAQQIQGVGSALPQATGVVAYPMQQFQVSPQVRINQDILNII